MTAAPADREVLRREKSRDMVLAILAFLIVLFPQESSVMLLKLAVASGLLLLIGIVSITVAGIRLRREKKRAREREARERLRQEEKWKARLAREARRTGGAGSKNRAFLRGLPKRLLRLQP